jgi:hypothetical protein
VPSAAGNEKSSVTGCTSGVTPQEVIKAIIKARNKYDNFFMIDKKLSE